MSSSSTQSGWDYLKAFFAGGLQRLSDALSITPSPATEPTTVQDTPPPTGNRTLLWVGIGLALLIIALVVWKKRSGV